MLLVEAQLFRAKSKIREFFHQNLGKAVVNRKLENPKKPISNENICTEKRMKTRGSPNTRHMAVVGHTF
jgi:hypothetical protein